MGNFNFDIVMAKAYRCLCEDFRDNAYWDVPTALGSLSISEIRAFDWPDCAGYRPYSFRAVHQLKHFFDRYRFTHDVKTDDELRMECHKKFCDTQQRISSPMNLDCGTKLILKRARKLAKEILGPVDLEEIMSKGRFSKNATVCSPLSLSSLDEKMGRLSGSVDHIRLFHRYVSGDPLLSQAIREVANGEPEMIQTSVLKVTFVPKSWKSFRSITPNTTIGSYITSSIGDVLTERLESIGLGLSRQQPRQQNLAREASVRRHLVTADLSSASDSFASDLLNMILPRDWFNLLRLGRIGTVKVGDSHIYLSSFMTMGIGFTFPLQTLIFYCLLRAIKEALFPRLSTHLISVFGDDLIYPVAMHGIVVHVFRACRFIINQDKTFCSGWFRESCGGDFYEGVDVRPAMPDVPSQQRCKFSHLASLYKVTNSILRRWNKVEVPKTYEYLTREILKHQGTIYYVPDDYPDFSGIRVDALDPRCFKNVELLRRHGCFWLAFRCLSQRGKSRHVAKQTPYLWLKLSILERPSRGVDWRGAPDSSILMWKREKIRIDNRKIIKLRPYTSLKQVASFVEKISYVPAWSQD